MLKPTIKVYVRCRPASQANYEPNLKIIGESNSIFHEESNKFFHYDGVYGDKNSQEDIFQNCINPLLPKIKQKKNLTVIAYGQTGSGKTYTMGTNPTSTLEEDAGILQRSVKALLVGKATRKSRRLESTPTDNPTLHLKITMLEIYKDSVYDLFCQRKAVLTKPDGHSGVYPVDCCEEKASTVSEAIALLRKGNALRTSTSTAMNSSSSRSHALISVTLVKEEAGVDYKLGCLQLVDLAGAEGVGRNHTEGTLFSEGVSINTDLLVVGKVLAALNQGSSYIPYRDSMITRLLRKTFDGSGSTVMMTCISLDNCNLNVTMNTLRYAEQARDIKIRSTPAASAYKKRFTSCKRSAGDLSATPGAWKKYKSQLKPNQNSTISTPGHKPPSWRTHNRNNTFVALNSCSKLTNEHEESLSSSNRIFAVPLQPLIFEEDSPTHSIIEAPSDSPTFSSSRYLQQKLQEYEKIIKEQDKLLEKMTAERNNVSFMAQLNQTAAADGLNCTVLNESSSVQTLIKKMVAQEFANQSVLLKDQLTVGRSPFQDISNSKKICQGIDEYNINDAPVTSTVIQENRLIRKSKRSTISKSIDNFNSGNIASNSCTPVHYSTSPMAHSVLEITAIYNGASPVLAKKKINNLNVDAEQTISKPAVDNLSFLQDTTIILSPSAPRRRTSRRSAIHAIQKNHALLSKESPLEKMKKKLCVNSRSSKSSALNQSLNWKSIMSPASVKKHEQEILSILNSNNLRELQKLPTVGPKTAMVLKTFRMSYGDFSCIQDLKNVPGVPSSYFSRFIKANMVCQSSP